MHISKAVNYCCYCTHYSYILKLILPLHCIVYSKVWKLISDWYRTLIREILFFFFHF